MANVRCKLAAVFAAFVALVLTALFNPGPILDWDGDVLPLAQAYAQRRHTNDGNPKLASTPLTEVVVVITGATSGIGLKLSQMFHKLGATVVAIGRSRKKLNDLEADLPGVVTVQADFSDLDQVSKAADTIQQSFDQIDILINNAGLHNGFAVPGESAQGYDMVFTVNYLSHFLLTEKLASLLARSPNPVVFQCSSTYHFAKDGEDLIPSLPKDKSLPQVLQPTASRVVQNNLILKGRPFRERLWASALRIYFSHCSYANTKLAQLLHLQGLRQRHELLGWKSGNKDIRLVAACPGFAKTGILEASGQFQSIMESLAFDVHRFGMASILTAIFDSPAESPTKEEDVQYYVNSRVMIMGRALFERLPKPLGHNRGVVFAGVAPWGLLLQRLLAKVYATKSSPESTNETIANELYDWSMDAIQGYL